MRRGGGHTHLRQGVAVGRMGRGAWGPGWSWGPSGLPDGLPEGRPEAAGEAAACSRARRRAGGCVCAGDPGDSAGPVPSRGGGGPPSAEGIADGQRLGVIALCSGVTSSCYVKAG